MPTSSARPSALRAFEATGRAIDEDSLAPRVVPLGEALDAFRATSGWSDWLGDVPPLDVDVGSLRGRLDQMVTFVAQVAAGFEAADTTPDTDDVVTAGDDRIASHVTVDLDTPLNLVFDGERWIFPGTEEADYVRVVTRDGGTYLEVGVPFEDEDGRWHIRWESRRLSADQAADLVIRTGGGNDVIAVSPDIDLRITVWSGGGDDEVGMPGENFSSRLGGGGADRIFTGDGSDRVFGGAGRDEIYAGAGNDFADGQGGSDRVVGGGGVDTLYGGTEDDAIEGGTGDDYLEGGSGNDSLGGGGGRDLLSGGRGNDVLGGGDGADDLFGGRGEDDVTGGMGDDKATSEEQDRVVGVETRVTIELTGSPGETAIDLGSRPGWMTEAEWDAWVERIDSDLEFLRTTETGRAGLAALDQASRDSDSGANPFDDDTHIRIVPFAPNSDGNILGLGARPEPLSFDDYIEMTLNGEDPYDGAAANALDEWVNYRPELGSDSFESGPPTRTLYHELSHSWDNMHNGAFDIGGRTYTERVYDADGNLVSEEVAPRPELNSVGFDIDGDGTIDTVGAGDGTDHPEVLTENALRDELRRPRRLTYLSHDDVGRVHAGDGVTVEYGDTGD